jgi:hypothetical protein
VLAINAECYRGRAILEPPADRDHVQPQCDELRDTGMAQGMEVGMREAVRPHKAALGAEPNVRCGILRLIARLRSPPSPA